MAGGPPIPPELRGPGEDERRLRADRMAKANADLKSRLVSVSTIGTEFAVTVGGAGLIGWIIDKLADSAPWGILVGFGIGLVVGFIRFIKEATALSRPPSESGGSKPESEDAPEGPKEAR